MLIEILKAIFLAGIPVAVISYNLVRLTNKNRTVNASNAKELKQELKTIEFEKNSEEGHIKQMLYKKYLKFGGGFYGVLAFITYIHIEIFQIIDFFKNFKSFSSFIDSIGFGMIIKFFIEAIVNLITAFTWPFYWFKYLPIGSFWVWIIVTIIAHSLATKFALRRKHILDTDNTNNNS